MFRVWETQTWTCQKWSNFSSYCQCAVWSPDSETLAIVIHGTSIISCLAFPKVPPRIGKFFHGWDLWVEGYYIRSDDIGEYAVMSKSGKEIKVGGPIQDIAWDATGERFVVTFSGKNEPLIAVYATTLSPFLDFVPRGFIRGAKVAGRPCLVKFRPNFSRGALLATVRKLKRCQF